VVESTALEMRRTGNRIGGSNPSLSASFTGVAHLPVVGGDVEEVDHLLATIRCCWKCPLTMMTVSGILTQATSRTRGTKNRSLSEGFPCPAGARRWILQTCGERG
jgi:hypothetical protein